MEGYSLRTQAHPSEHSSSSRNQLCCRQSTHRLCCKSTISWSSWLFSSKDKRLWRWRKFQEKAIPIRTKQTPSHSWTVSSVWRPRKIFIAATWTNRTQMISEREWSQPSPQATTRSESTPLPSARHSKRDLLLYNSPLAIHWAVPNLSLINCLLNDFQIAVSKHPSVTGTRLCDGRWRNTSNESKWRNQKEGGVPHRSNSNMNC